MRCASLLPLWMFAKVGGVWEGEPMQVKKSSLSRKIALGKAAPNASVYFSI
jgi:hypothetical protein